MYIYIRIYIHKHHLVVKSDAVDVHEVHPLAGGLPPDPDPMDLQFAHPRICKHCAPTSCAPTHSCAVAEARGCGGRAGAGVGAQRPSFMGTQSCPQVRSVYKSLGVQIENQVQGQEGAQLRQDGHQLHHSQGLDDTGLTLFKKFNFA